MKAILSTIMLTTMFGYCLISNDICYLGQSGSVGASDLIPCKALLNSSMKYPSVPPQVMFCAVQWRQNRNPWLGTDAYTYTNGKIHKSGRHRLRHRTDRQEDRRYREKEVENSNPGSFLIRWHQGEWLFHYCNTNALLVTRSLLLMHSKWLHFGALCEESSMI